MVKKPQRLKVNRPTQKKCILDQIANFLAHLPGNPAVILTLEQYKAWASQRRDNYWIGQCFVASFECGDPLRPLLKAKKLTTEFITTFGLARGFTTLFGT